ncbi:MAG: glutamate synthase-related protein [Pseudomonadota bacterium]
MSDLNDNPWGLYDPEQEHSSCGVGFITRKDGKQKHEVLKKGHEALCAVPHRGGMSSEGVGDGAGISVDLSVELFSRLTGAELEKGRFGVGNFFMPENSAYHERAIALVEDTLAAANMPVLLRREVPVDEKAIESRGIKHQLPIIQWVFSAPEGVEGAKLDQLVYETLLLIEATAYTDPDLTGLYPLSLSVHTQVFKGRLNSWEIVPYFQDLSDPDHAVHTLFFHTRFSTNTDPHPSMAQPFRLMAHNGELNTDKKNRLSETAVASAKSRAIIRPKGQSDSCRLDQTLNGRVFTEGLELVAAVVSMMPPAWENDESLSPQVRDMLAFFSLYEEKNDGPAALVFGDGRVIGARLDRLGLRPLRSVETEEYLAVMSEAGQVYFSPEEVTARGRIEAGGMLYYDHHEQRIYDTKAALEKLAGEADYSALLAEAQIPLSTLSQHDLLAGYEPKEYEGDLSVAGRYVAYTHNQESFKFLMDPMLVDGVEKVSAMGYGNAINALSDTEGGVAKYFSQRFAQVTNPPLDSIREADGMTLRVALGEKPHGGLTGKKQIVLDTPVLTFSAIQHLKTQTVTPCASFDVLFSPDLHDSQKNEEALIAGIENLAEEVARFTREQGGIAILSDRNISSTRAALPMTLAVSAVNQRLIEEGLRLRVSLVVESGQVASSHHIACALGFGASAVYALAVRMRAEEKYPDDADQAFGKFAKAAEKALMKTMGKVGLCTVESYSGGEFFEPNFLDTTDPVFKRYLPNMYCPVGGVRFASIAQSAADWHQRALSVTAESDVPILGLFKERTEGAGHSYGTMAVRGFVDMTEEAIQFSGDEPLEHEDASSTLPNTLPNNEVEGSGHSDTGVDELRLLTLRQLGDAFGINEKGYVNTSFDLLTTDQIDNFEITPGFRAFSRAMAEERSLRPAALRDVLAFPADITFLESVTDIKREMMLFNRAGNRDFVIRGLLVEKLNPGDYRIVLTGPKADDLSRLDALAQSLVERFGADVESHWIEQGALHLKATGMADDYVSRIVAARPVLALDQVQPASEITPRLASGAMSHGALVASAHEAVAHGTNMAGGMSNCGEGGEHQTRYGTIRASRIKQFASGRFGVWAGYLADPKLEEIEIKIGQGAKPGEGGQLPGPKVTVEIAAARGGTPGVELISPPPHHDTYSIEDLGQLIHDAKAARVRVIVKLVSSEGIGTIAVGVAKAGADVINVAGSTGGTGAASVTSLKYTGRAAELGIAEVHQALCANGIRQKVMLRCSGAMQTGSDVVKACLLGGDSFEFGTTALMMLKCVMAKNCNVKCPAGLTTNAEAFNGDPRALAQYLVNIAQEVRELLAQLGLRSLDEARGRADLLHLLDHPSSVGQLNLRNMLLHVPELRVANPTYLERDYSVDDDLLSRVDRALFQTREKRVVIKGIRLHNRNKSVGGQLSIDLERFLNHQRRDMEAPSILSDDRGRRFLAPASIRVETSHSAGQSYGAFCNNGIVLHHSGTCNDGVGKGASGGEIIVVPPLRNKAKGAGQNVLIGNFALFGATGGRLFVRGECGDRFAVRNSGATAVVEGVGDFCCEYMTNGSVLNLGGFSKGFGNGMSGGFAYQYDPEGRFADAVSHDSVITGGVTDGSAMADIHGNAIRQLLAWHLVATGSPLAGELLHNWDLVSKDFVWVMPRALLLYQDADAILKAKDRKELTDELATALATHQIMRLKRAWKDELPVLGGAIPLGEEDSEETFELLNNWTVLDTALEVVRKKNKPLANDALASRLARNLVMTEDFELMSRLAKHARLALSGYDDDELAALIADKRLGDFRTALAMRNVRSMDSPGTYGWILDQSRKNRERLGRIPSFEELFAGQAIPERLILAEA